LGRAIDAHLPGCPACESIRLLYARMDEALRQEPVWEPPKEFARRIGAHAPMLARSRPSAVPLILSRLTDAVLVAGAGYLGVRLVELFTPVADRLILDQTANAFDAYQRFVVLAAEASVANVVPVSWGCAVLSLTAAVWLTRRAFG
jgi:anti-sigma factor RsiW